MLPKMCVYTVISDLEKFNQLMTEVLGIHRIELWNDAEADAAWYCLSNAIIVALQPHRPDSPIGVFFQEQGGGIFGLEILNQEPAPGSLDNRDEGVPIVATGRLSTIQYRELPESKIRLLKGPHVECKYSGINKIAMDHLAYVVEDLGVTLDELRKLENLEQSTTAGRWDFPELGSTNAIVPFHQAFLELNQVIGKGLFESAYSRYGPSALFLCLRVNDLRSEVQNLLKKGVKLSAPSPVIARKQGVEEQQILGQVSAFSLRQTQGARIMLLEPDWPWNVIPM